MFLKPDGFLFLLARDRDLEQIPDSSHSRIDSVAGNLYKPFENISDLIETHAYGLARSWDNSANRCRLERFFKMKFNWHAEC